MKEITYEQYKEYMNDWEDPNKPGVGKYIYRVPKGKRLVMTSSKRYYLADIESISANKPKKK